MGEILLRMNRLLVKLYGISPFMIITNFIATTFASVIFLYNLLRSTGYLALYNFLVSLVQRYVVLFVFRFRLCCISQAVSNETGFISIISLCAFVFIKYY